MGGIINKIVWRLDVENCGYRNEEIGAELARKWQKSGHFLRDEIAVGRGVHRKMGVPIQKSRSNFRGNLKNHVILGFSGLV